MGKFVELAMMPKLEFLWRVSKLGLLLGMFSVCFAGCGDSIPELGQVNGTVSMNGKPLPGVGIAFSPDPSAGHTGRTSRGVTDEEGRYTLTYRTSDGQTAEGASVGLHLVSITDVLCIESRDKPIPYRFSLALGKFSSSPFNETVEPGENEINFDLTEYPNR